MKGWMLFVGLFLLVGVIRQGSALTIGDESAIAAAEAMGYKEIEVERHTFFIYFRGCGVDDTVLFSVSASKDGVRREFSVCEGPFQDATVRF